MSFDPRFTCERANPDPRIPKLALRLLCRRVYAIPRYGRVLCRLWQVRTIDSGIFPRKTFPAAYAVSLEGLGYRRFCIIGRDAERARDIFDLLVRNTVTPCALMDVLEEMGEDRV